MEQAQRSCLSPDRLIVLRRVALSVAEEASRQGQLDRYAQALSDYANLFRQSVSEQADHALDTVTERPSGATPAFLLRAEGFLRRHADRPVLLRDVAEAAGCSLRALQLAFRRFRNTTPAAALRRVRLEHARKEIIGSTQPVTAIARRFQFTNMGRFAAAYTSQFGETAVASRQRVRR